MFSLYNWAPRTRFTSVCKAKYAFGVDQNIRPTDEMLTFLEFLNSDLEGEQSASTDYYFWTMYGDLLC